jgi:hypothetical protein
MTTTWTNGYQTEVNYTYGYYRDLSPNFQKFCLLLNGIESPEAQENQTHCELGFGQGVSINIHAASNEALFTALTSIQHTPPMPINSPKNVKLNIIFMMIVLRSYSIVQIYQCLTLSVYMAFGVGLVMKINTLF